MKHKYKYFIILFLTLLFCISAIPMPDMSIKWDTSPIEIKKGEVRSLNIELDLPEGYSLIAENTYLEFQTLEGLDIKDIIYPDKMKKSDPIGGDDIDIYKTGEISVKIVVPDDAEFGDYDLHAVLFYQLCSKEACLRITEKKIEWHLVLSDGASGVKQEVKINNGFTLSGITDFFKNRDQEKILSIGFKYLFFIALLGGLLSSFTPCVLPIIPITLLMIGVNPKKRVWKNFLLSFVLVLGLASIYAVIGVFAGFFGVNFGFLFESNVFITIVILFFLAMALSLIGVFSIALPTSFTNLITRLGGKGYFGAFLAGISMGILATPCVGPVLGALLLYASATKNILISFLLIMTYGIGFGALIIVVGTWYGTFAAHLKKARLKYVKKVLGFLILIPLLYYLNTLIPFANIFEAKDKIAWQGESVLIEKRNLSDSKPKMIFFTSKWCTPCKILKSFVLKDDDVFELSKSFDAIIIESSKNTRETALIMDKYKIYSFPTIIFLSPELGRYKDLTLSGAFMTKSELLEAMNKALDRM